MSHYYQFAQKYQRNPKPQVDPLHRHDHLTHWFQHYQMTRQFHYYQNSLTYLSYPVYQKTPRFQMNQLNHLYRTNQ
jgi:hypothetical protein